MDYMRDLGILVVDKNPDITEMIERLFGHFDVKAECVPNMFSALERLTSCFYNTMVIRFDLPNISGEELSNGIRVLYPALNMVLIIGDTPNDIMKLILDPTVYEVSETVCNPCNFGDMLLTLFNNENGKTYVLR